MLLFGFLFIRERRLLSIALLLSGLIILLLTKYFLLICLLPALLAYHFFISRKTLTQVLLKYAAVIVLTLIILLAISPIGKGTNFARIIYKKQTYAIAEAKYMKAGSYSPVPAVDSTILSVTSALPIGLWGSMFKPYLWQSRNPMMLLSAAENIAILLLILLALIYRDRQRSYDYNILFFFALSVILYFSIIGIMTPVLGNLVRYKVVLIPPLIFILISVMDINRLPFISRRK